MRDDSHAHGDKLGIFSALGDTHALSNDKLRLGGGIENGFAFLTHLRYQFCLLSNDARKDAQTRMVRIFTDAIREHRLAVSAADLFCLLR